MATSRATTTRTKTRRTTRAAAGGNGGGRAASSATAGKGNGNGKKSAGVTLADLDPATRAELAAQLLQEQEAARNAHAADLEQAGADATERVRELMDDRDHMRGCPNDGRVEAYPAHAPAQPARGIPAHEVTVIRCVECGGSSVVDEAYAAVVEKITARE